MALLGSAIAKMEMRDFRNLEIWNLGRQFAVLCYRETAAFPKEEQFNLTSQIRRAAVSIPANIAEGAGRDSDGDFLRFLRIALGSLNETETLFNIAADLGLISETQARKVEQAARDVGVRTRNLAQRIDSDLIAKNKK